jgi:putative two-component system response regulator
VSELKTVLVVDDTPENLDLMKAILAPHYKVKVAINGEAALKLVAAAAPDMVLLDVMMPGIDGYEVCRRLKEDPTRAHVPVVLVTAITEAMDEGKGFQIGAVDYITKPVSGPVVLARVATHLRLARLKAAVSEAGTLLAGGDAAGAAEVLRGAETG